MTSDSYTKNSVPDQTKVRLPWLQRNRLAGAVIALCLPILGGLLIAQSMPHGPATAGQALFVIAACFAAGLLSGFFWPSRWVLFLTPLVHVLAIELARAGVAGSTAGAIRLDSAYGLLALLLGRGFHGLVGLLPMGLGASFGADLARWLADRNTGISGTSGFSKRILRWSPRLVLLVLLLALAALIALPASTPAILGADGQPLPGSIAELRMVQLGGHEQGLLIRGHSLDKPVILYLSGGPGQSSLPYPRVIFQDMERDFIFVSWDQRGTGKSYAALDPTATLTLDQAVSDTIELTNYLRERFDEDKIYLLGESWGTTLGVLAVQRRPDLYHALISSGQMVSQRVTDQRLYADVLELAARKGDTALADKMHAYGEPPYADIPYAYGFVMGYYEALYKPYTPPQAFIQRGQRANLGPWGVMGSEYNFVEKLNVLRGLIDMFTVLYPQIQHIDLRLDAPRLETPVYILDGAAELTARRDLALEWYDLLDAPRKRLFTFENAAHAVAFEQYAAFHQIMLETILPETYPVK